MNQQLLCTAIPEYPPIRPLTLKCLFCGALPGRDCTGVTKVRLRVVHVARMLAAAEMDRKAMAAGNVQPSQPYRNLRRVRG